MKKNMGNTDRTIRLLLATAFAFLYFSGIVSSTLGIILLVLAVVFILTSFIGFCPLYSLFKLNTCKKRIER